MSPAPAERISIGFQGGQVLALKVANDELKELRKALEGGAGWHELADTDGAVVVDLRQVVYIRNESDEHRVGF